MRPAGGLRTVGWGGWQMLRRWFGSNLGLKAASLCLALLLWFHVTTDRVYQIQRTIPLQVVLEDTTLVLLERTPAAARVAFAGLGKELLKLWWKTPHLIVNVRQREPRRLSLPLGAALVSIPSGLAVTAEAVLDPLSVEIALDRGGVREVPVALRATVETDRSHVQVGPLTVTPTRVRARGARSELARLVEAPTEERSIVASEGPISVEVPLDAGEWRTVTFDPPRVRLVGEVERLMERRLEKVAVEVRGRYGSDLAVDPPAVSLLVVGPESVIARLSGSEVEAYITVDEPLTSEVFFTPHIILPKGVDLLSEQPKLFRAVRPRESALLAPPASAPG